MESLGKILNFSRYSEQQMERTKNDLGLSMPVAFLMHCAGFYRNYAKRDPYIEELRLLDRFASQMQNEPLSLALKELYTNDRCVAETYRDMMQKRNQLNPDAKSPITAKEAASLATNALLRVGKQVPRRAVTPFIDPGENSHIRFLSLCKEAPKHGDLFALLFSLEQEESTKSKCALLLEDKSFTQKVKSISRISLGGILATLLRECDGFRIELDRLTPPDSTVSLSVLTESYHGAYLIRIPREHEAEIFYAAKEQNARALIFAMEEKRGEMTLCSKQNELFRLDTNFLRGLLAQRLFAAKLENEKDGKLDTVDLSWENDPTNGISYTHVTCHPKNSFFKNAFYATLLAVMGQSLTGCAYSDQQLSLCLRVPAKSSEASDSACISILIALYRLQAELGILACEPMFIRDESLSSPVLSVFAFGEGKTLPTCLQESTGFVYMFTVREVEDHLPNFIALRDLLKRLCELRRSGALLSAYATQGDSLLTAFKTIMGGKYFCSMEFNSSGDIPRAPITVLVESSIPLENARFVGTTFQKDEDFDVFLRQIGKN